MTAFDFSDLPSEFSDSESVAVPWAQHNGATFEAGIAVASSWTTRSIATSAIFPNTSRELDVQAEGDRERGELVVYVPTPNDLRGIVQRNEAGARKADVIEWKQTIWQVVRVNDYSASGSFLEVFFSRANTTHTTLAAWIAEETVA